MQLLSYTKEDISARVFSMTPFFVFTDREIRRTWSRPANRSGATSSFNTNKVVVQFLTVGIGVTGWSGFRWEFACLDKDCQRNKRHHSNQEHCNRCTKSYHVEGFTFCFTRFSFFTAKQFAFCFCVKEMEK